MRMSPKITVKKAKDFFIDAKVISWIPYRLCGRQERGRQQTGGLSPRLRRPGRGLRRG